MFNLYIYQQYNFSRGLVFTDAEAKLNANDIILIMIVE